MRVFTPSSPCVRPLETLLLYFPLPGESDGYCLEQMDGMFLVGAPWLWVS